MANISFPDGASTIFNPAAYEGAAASEARNKTIGVKGKNTERKKIEGKKGFASFFEKAVLGSVKELPLSEDSFHALLDEVHNAGEKLAERPFPPEIQAYKEAVRNFVHYVVENSYDTEVQTGIERKIGTHTLMREHRKYTLVQVIDTKLEGMAASIMRGQMSQLQILEKLDEIKGLLIDLMQ